MANRYVKAALKLYTVAALIEVAVLSPLSYSVVPIVLVLWYLILLRWPPNRATVLMTDIFTFFAIVLLYSPYVDTFYPLLIALPVIGLVWYSLQETAVTNRFLEGESNSGRAKPTRLCMTILVSVGAVIVVALITDMIELLLAGAVMGVFFDILGFIILLKLPSEPVAVRIKRVQVIAGSSSEQHIEIETSAGVCGPLFLKQPYSWIELEPSTMKMNGQTMPLTLTVTPELSGPSNIVLEGQIVDRWGLFRRSFSLEVLELFVIPRARYAAWMAERYLAGTNQGTLPLITNMEIHKPSHGLRQGVEYYGSQLYQPGDSLKKIDWKHTVKYNELISKEYIEFTGQSAVLLINLAVKNEEEADKLIYNVIAMALSLAANDIPAAIAAYDQDKVVTTTASLHHRQLVVKALQVARDMVTYTGPVKYLDPPDLLRLRANIRRAGSSANPAAQVLKDLMQIEYNAVKERALKNPATRALRESLARAGNQANIVVISQKNHDAEALEYNTVRFRNRGNAVIYV